MGQLFMATINCIQCHTRYLFFVLKLSEHFCRDVGSYLNILIILILFNYIFVLKNDFFFSFLNYRVSCTNVFCFTFVIYLCINLNNIKHF